jgi:hypothetical protein
MMSVYKMWADAHIQESWTQDLENFVQNKKPQTHEELELAIQEYHEIKAKRK